LHVNRAGSAVLVIIEHYESTGTVGNLGNSANLGTKSILETDARERHDKRIAVDHLLVIVRWNAVIFRTHKFHLGASRALSQPDVTHGRKFELPHYDFLPFAET